MARTARIKGTASSAGTVPSMEMESSENVESQNGRQPGKAAKALCEVVETTREELRQITGLKLSTTVEMEKLETGWRISVEMLEKESIPNSMDILAVYESKVDENGHVLDFKRKGLRRRMDVESTAESES